MGRFEMNEEEDDDGSGRLSKVKKKKAKSMGDVEPNAEQKVFIPQKIPGKKKGLRSPVSQSLEGETANQEVDPKPSLPTTKEARDTAVSRPKSGFTTSKKSAKMGMPESKKTATKVSSKKFSSAGVAAGAGAGPSVASTSSTLKKKTAGSSVGMNAKATPIAQTEQVGLREGPSSSDDMPANARWCVSDKILGRGSFGTVYGGMDRLTGKMVAVKEVSVSKSSDVLKEIDLLAGLQHSNIVSYLGSFAKGTQTVCLVMEYVPYGSLDSILHTYKYIALPALRKYTNDILQGLAYLHNHQLIHRDIKPANILVGQDGKCKLADFGLSRDMGPEVSIYSSLNARDMAMSMPVGTPAYMSPEAIQGMKVMSSDIWAVGLSVLELATGDKPWSHLKASQPFVLVCTIIAQAQSGGSVQAPEWLPPDFSDFIGQCLLPEHEKRSTASSLLQHQWLNQDNPDQAMVIPPRFRGANTEPPKGIDAILERLASSSQREGFSSEIFSSNAGSTDAWLNL